ncbi:MAG: DUF4349 domain-containing protein [Thermomicrobium sp.]|nr:DUF4349 domain-containing protein [Thermomicrobium sp.]MDW8058662.1 DUF4349 domain-containing protein [Thermomicrobium sp.]
MRSPSIVLVTILLIGIACVGPKERTATTPVVTGGGSGSSVEPAATSWSGGNERFVVCEAELVLEGAAIGRVADRVQALARQYGGYVGEAEIATGTEASEPNQARLVVLVPSERLEDFLAAVTSLPEIVRVPSRIERRNDVTDAVIDVAARRRSLERTEARLQELLGRASTIDEILRVEQELSRIRAEIERLAARENELQRRIAYAEVRILVVPWVRQGQPTLAETVREAWATSLLFLRLVVHAFVRIVVSSWWMLIAVGAAAVGGVAYRRRRRRRGGATNP